MQKLESRLRLLIANSPQLKYNSDGVNTIETNILKAREKLFGAKQIIVNGKISDPTELDYLLKLEEANSE